MGAKVNQEDFDYLRKIAAVATFVRLAQKRYFAGKSREDLFKSKELERQLDLLLNEQIPEPELFEEGEQ